MPGAAFACVVCKVQVWESVHLQVIFRGPGDVVFPSGCPEISPGDPRARGSDILPWEGCSFAPWGDHVRELRRCFEGFRAFLLDAGIFEAHICPRIGFLPLVRGIALRGGGSSEWSYYLLLVGGSKSESLTFYSLTLAAK